MIDRHTVVRLKQGLTNQQRKDSKNWGTRTDYLCARSPIYHGDTPFWLFPDRPHPIAEKWLHYFWSFNPRTKARKPSTGLCAVFCAIEFLNPSEIALIGFDRILNPQDECTGKWHEPRRFSKFGSGSHDQRAEYECLHSLGVRIIDLAKEYETEKKAEAV